jgi:hypothetical protein
MRWTQPKHGEHRQRRVFLWFPRTLNRETRWLEMATVEQEYWFTSWLWLKWVD